MGSGTDQAKKMENRTFRGFLDNSNYVVDIHKISAERGVKWEDAHNMFKAQTDSNSGFYLSKSVPERNQTIVLVINTGRASSRNLCLVRPNTGRSFKTMSSEEVHERFTRLSYDQAESEWKKQYEGLTLIENILLKSAFLAFGNVCLHKFVSGSCKKEEANEFCEFGRRSRTYFVMTGSVIAIWPLLEKELNEAKLKGK